MPRLDLLHAKKLLYNWATAPEKWMHEHALYEVRTGHLPFQGQIPTTEDPSARYAEDWTWNLLNTNQQVTAPSPK